MEKKSCKVLRYNCGERACEVNEVNVYDELCFFFQKLK